MASIGKGFQFAGASVTAIKIDPYLNEDASMLSPYEHGEVYVTDDGGQCDQDAGTYYRMLNIPISKHNFITGGKAHKRLRSNIKGGGRTVQTHHIAQEAISMILEVAQNIDVCLVELGGTIGDDEHTHFLQALRYLPKALHFHVVFLPTYRGELKTTPAKHNANACREAGLQPDAVLQM